MLDRTVERASLSLDGAELILYISQAVLSKYWGVQRVCRYVSSLYVTSGLSLPKASNGVKGIFLSIDSIFDINAAF